MRTSQHNLFGQFVGIVGGACCITALVMHSVVPLVIGCVALFCMLSFMNGLGTRIRTANA